jgi:hypothetical protein
MGYTTTHASGSQYWIYEGESLDERRRRFEEAVSYLDNLDEESGSHEPESLANGLSS